MLLDTHVWFWYVMQVPRLRAATLKIIEQAEADGALYLCPISLWELTLKVSQGTVHLDLPVRLWLHRAITLSGIHLTEITIDVACECADLPSAFHGDPGDRLIASTARNEGMTLITHDKNLLRLARQGYFKAVAA